MAGSTEPGPRTIDLDTVLAGRLILGWSRPRLAINTTDTLELGLGEVAAGLKSHLMLIEDWTGLSRDDALEFARQIKQDQADLEKVNPEMAKARAMPMPPGQDGGGEADDPEDSGQGDGSGIDD